jgi:hypothetical protein
MLCWWTFEFHNNLNFLSSRIPSLMTFMEVCCDIVFSVLCDDSMSWFGSIWKNLTVFKANTAQYHHPKMKTQEFTQSSHWRICWARMVANCGVHWQAQLDYESVCRRRCHNLHQETTSPLVTETNRDRGDKLVIDKNCNATLAATQASNQPLDTNTQLLQGELFCPGTSYTKLYNLLTLWQSTPSCILHIM